MSFDVERARAETPGCRNVMHFNNAGAALMPQNVVSAVTDHLRLEAEIGGYEAAEAAHEATERAYDSIARLIGAARDEVAIIENATRAWDMAFYSIAFSPGDRILTSVAEYASNYIAYLQVSRKSGASVEVVPNDETGRLSVEALRNMMDERVRLISLTHVPTNGGLVNPTEEVGAAAREFGCLYLLDACQSVGQMPIDVERIGCHMLAATGRKFLRGPRGTGFLYARKDVIKDLTPPFLDLHAARWVDRDNYDIRNDARRFENWESYVAGKIGLAAAVEYALQWGIDAIWERVRNLAEDLRDGLAGIPGVTIRDLGVEKCAIVTFTVDGLHPKTICAELKKQRINVSLSPPEYTLIDMERRQMLDGLVRASVHYYNTNEEIERLTAGVGALIK